MKKIYFIVLCCLVGCDYPIDKKDANHVNVNKPVIQKFYDKESDEIYFTVPDTLPTNELLALATDALEEINDNFKLRTVRFYLPEQTPMKDLPAYASVYWYNSEFGPNSELIGKDKNGLDVEFYFNGIAIQNHLKK